MQGIGISLYILKTSQNKLSSSGPDPEQLLSSGCLKQILLADHWGKPKLRCNKKFKSNKR